MSFIMDLITSFYDTLWHLSCCDDIVAQSQRISDETWEHKPAPKQLEALKDVLILVTFDLSSYFSVVPSWVWWECSFWASHNVLFDFFLRINIVRCKREHMLAPPDGWHVNYRANWFWICGETLGWIKTCVWPLTFDLKSGTYDTS